MQSFGLVFSLVAFLVRWRRTPAPRHPRRPRRPRLHLFIPLIFIPLIFIPLIFIPLTQFTAAGMTSSYVAASWAAATALAVYFDGHRTSPRLLFATFVVPCYFGCGIAVTTMFHVVEKIGIAGGADSALGKLVADGVVGSLAGLSTLLCMGSTAPWLAYILGNHKRPFCRILVGISTLAAVLSTSHRLLTMEPKNGVPYTKAVRDNR